MKIKTSETTRIQINWLVAKCENILHPWGHIRVQDGHVMWISPGNHEVEDSWHEYSPSSEWLYGGPIIEREGITVSKEDGFWSAYFRDNLFKDDGSEHWQTGQTPLIAAMRCYVASKLGDEVEVPDELT